MSRSLMKILIMLAVSLGFQGCTCQAWYDALKERQRLDCQNLPGVRERRDCLDRVNSQTYDQYKSEREKSRDSNP